MKTVITLWLFLSLAISNAQVGIGTNDPEESSILDVESSSKGFLPPRLTVTQRDAITNPAEGLMVYVSDTQCSHKNGVHFYNGTTWTHLSKGSLAVYTDLFKNQVFGGSAPGTTLANSIRSTNINSRYTALSNAAWLFNTAISGNEFHVYNSDGNDATTEFGFALDLLCSYRINTIEITARYSVSTSAQRIANRPNNLFIRLYKNGILVHDGSASVTSGAVPGTVFTINIPDGVVADELHIIKAAGSPNTYNDAGIMNPGEIKITSASSF